MEPHFSMPSIHDLTAEATGEVRAFSSHNGYVACFSLGLPHYESFNFYSRNCSSEYEALTELRDAFVRWVAAVDQACQALKNAAPEAAAR